jgi:hypothetical protein
MIPSAPEIQSGNRNSGRALVLQGLTLAVAVCISAAILLPGQSTTHRTDGDFDMLAFLDAQVAMQEDKKDVRCWSSFCKLQMFLTGAQIKEEAIGIRIDAHMKLLESIWEEASQTVSANTIEAPALTPILKRRFPHEFAESGATFNLGGLLAPIVVVPDALKDYADTIEPWRLLQTWASRHTDAYGKLNIRPQYNQESLGVLHAFLLAYDLAILKNAQRVAQENKKSVIDAASMTEAFKLEFKLRG